MRDVELYRHLLGLEEPWMVRSVELKVAEQRVDVWAGHAEGVRWPCPECGTELSLYDHAEERVWRHLDSCTSSRVRRGSSIWIWRPTLIPCGTICCSGKWPGGSRTARSCTCSSCCSKPPGNGAYPKGGYYRRYWRTSISRGWMRCWSGP